MIANGGRQAGSGTSPPPEHEEGTWPADGVQNHEESTAQTDSGERTTPSDSEEDGEITRTDNLNRTTSTDGGAVRAAMLDRTASSDSEESAAVDGFEEEASGAEMDQRTEGAVVRAESSDDEESGVVRTESKHRTEGEMVRAESSDKSDGETSEVEETGTLALVLSSVNEEGPSVAVLPNSQLAPQGEAEQSREQCEV